MLHKLRGQVEKDIKNQRFSIAGYMERHSRVIYPGPGS